MSDANTPTPKINPSLQKKSAARIAAVQCVYERLMSDIAPTPARQVARLKKRLANNNAEQKLLIGMVVEPNYPLVSAILDGTVEFQTDIDKRIDSNLSKEWTRERMSPILIAVLQCAVFELFFYKENKHKVIIDEYTRLTSRFFAEAEVNFVHGLLHTLHTEFHA